MGSTKHAWRSVECTHHTARAAWHRADTCMHAREEVQNNVEVARAPVFAVRDDGATGVGTGSGDVKRGGPINSTVLRRIKSAPKRRVSKKIRGKSDGTCTRTTIVTTPHTTTPPQHHNTTTPYHHTMQGNPVQIGVEVALPCPVPVRLRSIRAYNLVPAQPKRPEAVIWVQRRVTCGMHSHSTVTSQPQHSHSTVTA